MAQIQFPDFMAVTFGLVTYLLGEAINDRVPAPAPLLDPHPVTGGLLVALLFFPLHETGVAAIAFDTHARASCCSSSSPASASTPASPTS